MPPTSRYSAHVRAGPQSDLLWWCCVHLAQLHTAVWVPNELACSIHLHGGLYHACSGSLQRTLARGLVCYFLSVRPSCVVCCGVYSDLDTRMQGVPTRYPLLKLMHHTSLVDNGPRLLLLLNKSHSAQSTSTCLSGCMGGWGQVMRSATTVQTLSQLCYAHVTLPSDPRCIVPFV